MIQNLSKSKYVSESCEVRYVGESCTGCHTFKKFIPFIRRINDDINESICDSCNAVLPKHIPKEQQKRFLNRIFRKELLLKQATDMAFKAYSEEEYHEIN